MKNLSCSQLEIMNGVCDQVATNLEKDRGFGNICNDSLHSD